MKLRHIYSFSLSMTLALLLSCRQPQDLDTDRTVVPTNLPEITDFSPKAGYLGDTITIIGKNFLNVESVGIDKLPITSYKIVSSNRIVAILPTEAVITTMAQLFRQGFLTLNVATKLGTASAPSTFIMAQGMITGKIMIANAPLDSADIFLTIPSRNLSGQTDLTMLRQQIIFSNPHPGWYILDSDNFLLQASLLQNPEEITIRPMRSGYGFRPVERIVSTRGRRQLTIAQDFEAFITPAQQMPEVTSVVPNSGRSFSDTSQQTGTTITLAGKGFSEVRKVLIGVPYTYTAALNLIHFFVSSIIFSEASVVLISNDSQMTIRLPRLQSQLAIRGGQYGNCRILIIRDDTSLLVPQRISIQYN